MFRSALLVAAIGAAACSQPLGAAFARQTEQSGTPRAPMKGPFREKRLMELQLRAQARIEAERFVFTAAQLADIEARYASAQAKERGLARPPGSERILEELVKRYPSSNRAGCALMELAQQSTGAQRERYLREAIRFEGDAWFENGVQVAALARAMLAVHLAGLERFDEAEQIATELVTRYPGSVDWTGASLDDTLMAIKLLRLSPRSL